MQGNIIVDAWNKSKISVDKNYDNALQYVMLEGSTNNIYAVSRINLSISTEKIASKICNWEEDEAKDAISNLFLKYGNKIEYILLPNLSLK
ncbi:hypothetical protein ACN077_02825 [Clostridium chromiireducens]|uniref:hypothetical protein n=1 Tax=Clostridium chromiireducens TaxID=225345 RepID=UPI003AF50E44